ncbi:uncharacterized protein LOC113464765 [Ceratina calcarata]|uniref:Uncharacterized protein LOC113464765 n=1 Tax=Ceratina calcarata TaxID=156304 RepID=A0AAJ7S6P4_9HYME|nr:uncharacterized protein LOC113464765 [Ceratina calcarata]
MQDCVRGSTSLIKPYNKGRRSGDSLGRRPFIGRGSRARGTESIAGGRRTYTCSQACPSICESGAAVDHSSNTAVDKSRRPLLKDHGNRTKRDHPSERNLTATTTPNNENEQGS